MRATMTATTTNGDALFFLNLDLVFLSFLLTFSLPSPSAFLHRKTQ